ncbi:MAG: hypothetical protein ACE5K4_06075 [Candidatus Hydrothermarchaeota archaeon]
MISKFTYRQEIELQKESYSRIRLIVDDMIRDYQEGFMKREEFLKGIERYIELVNKSIIKLENVNVPKKYENAHSHFLRATRLFKRAFSSLLEDNLDDYKKFIKEMEMEYEYGLALMKL